MALNELLRHFWSCFPVQSKFYEEKVVRMKTTLENFHKVKLRPFRDRHGFTRGGVGGGVIGISGGGDPTQQNDGEPTDRQAGLQSVIEDSLHSLTQKAEASLTASLSAKSALTNELRNLGEKVNSQNAIFEQWERLEEEAVFQRFVCTVLWVLKFHSYVQKFFC